VLRSAPRAIAALREELSAGPFVDLNRLLVVPAASDV